MSFSHRKTSNHYATSSGTVPRGVSTYIYIRLSDLMLSLSEHCHYQHEKDDIIFPVLQPKPHTLGLL